MIQLNHILIILTTVFIIFTASCGGGGGNKDLENINTGSETSTLDPTMPGGDMTIDQALDTEVEDRRLVFLSTLGPPDTFSKSIDEIEGKLTVSEEWAYIELGVRLDLIDGEIAYTSAIETVPETAALYPRFYDPMEFDLPMDKTKVMKMLDGQNLTVLDLSEADIEDSLMILGDQIMLGFSGDQLVYVETYARVPDTLGEFQQLFIDAEEEEEEDIITVELLPGIISRSTSLGENTNTVQNRQTKASVVESLLPQQAKLVIGFFRLFRAHNQRNRIYREANNVQADYSAYIEKLKKKAKELAAACNLSTLDRQSNIATLVKLIARLEMEKQMVDTLTEAEKKTARTRFIRKARGEIISAIKTSGFGTRVLEKIQSTAKIDDTLTDIQHLVDGVLDPGDFQKKITERLDNLGILGQVIGGPLGQKLRKLIIDAQRSIPGVADVQDKAAELQVIIIKTRDTIEEIEDALKENTSILSPVQLVLALEAITNTLSDPAVDVFAAALAKAMDPGFARNLAISKGQLDPQELGTMQERVRGEILQNRSEWLRKRARGECGRPAGSAFRTVVMDNVSKVASSGGGTRGYGISTDSESTLHLGPDGSPIPVCSTMPIDLSGPIDDIFKTLNTGDLIDLDDIPVCRTPNDKDGDGSNDIATGGDDCDDSDKEIFPGNTEVCDGKDNDCDGQIDEGLYEDADGDGYYTGTSCASPSGDCNDNDDTIYPGATEIENDGIDQDCDGKDDVPEYKRYYVYKRSGTGYRKKYSGWADKITGYDFFYLYVLPSQLDDAVAKYSKFNEATAKACSNPSPALCPCTTYPDIWQSGTIELIDSFDTFAEMSPYQCDTYQFDPANIICTQWEVDSDPKYWDNIDGICGY
ncbi:MAG: putative metal-binding motif-containing protein [Proteobacteria bacterium]|nr:putative metal-binding motif-containing protein [Pseudomonadota bacterium]